MSQVFNKKLHSISHLFQFIKDNSKTAAFKRTPLVSKAFSERIILVVTEVNGCKLCSYAHTNKALKNGVSSEDIQAMLSGNMDYVSEEESVALFFAQHYADTNGQPSKASWDRLTKVYGEEKALGILGHTRTIMIGNTVGIALGALKDRCKGNAVAKSSLGYELGITFSSIPLLLSVAIASLFKDSKNQSLITFD